MSEPQPSSAALSVLAKEASGAEYRITHITRYQYDQPVSFARHLFHLSPRSLPWQACQEHIIDIDPEPTSIEHARDAFGNIIQRIVIERSHSGLQVGARTRVSVGKRPPLPVDSPSWESVRTQLTYNAQQTIDAQSLEATRFTFESPIVRIKREFTAWAVDCFPAGQSLHLCVEALMHKLHRELVFDPEATNVSTPVLEVLARKRGVCQDFSHLMISCLRSLGLAARYVSGYLLTIPPEGQERLIGADASHAWVAVYCPGYGWLEVDPTNAIFPDQCHITLGWGRDFTDVSPLRGVIVGGGVHEPEIEVTVMPIDTRIEPSETPAPETAARNI